METRRYELTSSERNRIKDMLPPEHPKAVKHGRPAKYDNRRIINGILWLAGSEAPWKERPKRCGKWQAVYARFSQAIREYITSREASYAILPKSNNLLK